MVNIQAIIYIGDVARLFGSLESYRAFCYQGATPAQTAQKQQLKVQAGIAEHQFAIAYNCVRSLAIPLNLMCVALCAALTTRASVQYGLRFCVM